jgi:hypothetical protein
MTSFAEDRTDPFYDEDHQVALGECGARRMVANRYQLTRLLGCGEMRVVRQTRDKRLGRGIALRSGSGDAASARASVRPTPERSSAKLTCG